MVPGAASGVLDQRETSKAVNGRIVITSIREKGINRKVKLTVCGVPIDTPDETILQYVELFAEFEVMGRKTWWESISQEEQEILYALQKMSALTEYEIKATEGARVTISRPERGRKETLIVNIMAMDTDKTLRKIRSSIEEP